MLVDFVDSDSGATIVGTRHVDPVAPFTPSPQSGDAISAIVKRNPELYDYLRCDLPLTNPVMNAMMPILCGQMRP